MFILPYPSNTVNMYLQYTYHMSKSLPLLHLICLQRYLNLFLFLFSLYSISNNVYCFKSGSQFICNIKKWIFQKRYDRSIPILMTPFDLVTTSWGIFCVGKKKQPKENVNFVLTSNRFLVLNRNIICYPCRTHKIFSIFIH